jgi:hypothetical protein
VLATLWEHGGLERPSSARACVSLAARSHVWQQFGFGMGVSTIALNVSYNEPQRRNIEEEVAKFGGVWLVEDRSCTLKPVCGVVHLVLGGLHEVRRSFGCELSNL